MSETVLEITDLAVSFDSAGGRVAALNGVSFSVARGEVLALLGESGSGKSVTAAAVMDLIQQPPGAIDAGAIRYKGVDLLTLSRHDRRAVCGGGISLIFQDALAALNPVYSIGWQIAELFRIHQNMPRAEANRRAVALMGTVGIPEPEIRSHQYPHQFSGGMRQRVMIAMAVALEPDLIIADEPTTALDVTVQAQIVDLLDRLRRRTNSALIFITHDLGVVAELADRVAVMYAGRIVETAGVEALFGDPRHPYTTGLLASQPRIDDDGEDLRPIPGAAPNPINLPSGCAFRTRCPLAQPICAEVVPPLRELAPEHFGACHFAVTDP